MRPPFFRHRALQLAAAVTVGLAVTACAEPPRARTVATPACVEADCARLKAHLEKAPHGAYEIVLSNAHPSRDYVLPFYEPGLSLQARHDQAPLAAERLLAAGELQLEAGESASVLRVSGRAADRLETALRGRGIELVVGTQTVVVEPGASFTDGQSKADAADIAVNVFELIDLGLELQKTVARGTLDRYADEPVAASSSAQVPKAPPRTATRDGASEAVMWQRHDT